MEQHHRQIRVLLTRVRARWRRVVAFQAAARASLAVSGVLAVALFLTYWTTRSPIALAAITLMALALAAGAIVWGLWPAREIPSDARVARFIEETDPSLDDRLASAVALAASPEGEARSALAAPMVADAARRVSSIDPAAVVPGRTVRRAGFRAAAAVLLLAAIGFSGRETVRRSFDAVSLALFPSRVALEVVPGNARIQAGSPLTIEARLLGNRAPVVAQVLRAEGAAALAAASGDAGVAWRTTEMATNPSGAFTLGLGEVAASFKYRVVAGAVTSPLYDVTVVRAPRVTRIDLEHLYPPGAGLAPHIEEDAGDIYAPAGTDVRLLIHTDREAATGQMTLGGGKTIALTAREHNVLTGTLKVLDDDSYRIALSDVEGLTNSGETEYFIRTLEDRPPEVRLLKPARDRSVTRLDEVDIEAQAEDDFGIERLELVYAVRGRAERVKPLAIPRQSASVTGTHTLYLEDLDVQPGDFVSYYVRARDLARGKRASETRSDIFFLDVKGFELEFRLAQSEGAMGATPNKSLDDLVTAQKDVIVATWKLDRRAQTANGAKSEQDIRAVSRAEAELKTRVEETSSSFRGSTMRDPRRGRGGVQPRRPGVATPPDTLKAGQTTSEEDAMTAAASAMGRAVQSLNALKTGQALAPEMDALNHLLKAQADVKKREVSRQQAPGEAGSNRTTQDMSRMFDKELQSQQQTNYETPKNAQQPEQPDSMLDKIKDLARRQDALLKEQQELARDRDQMTAEELKRELEKLTREQAELRQRAEEMAKEAASQQSQGGQKPSQSQSGRQSGQKQRDQSQSGRGSGGGGDTGEQIRAAAEEMRNAVSELRRDDPRQASARGSRALEQLRELQRQLQASAPDERRRALGDMQLEARQLADAQRQVASEVGKVAPGEAGQDALRRLAGEQERLADRARRLQQGLGQQAGTDAAKEIERERIPDRMRQSAEQLRSAAAAPNPGADRRSTKAAAAAQEEVARALDKVANGLSTTDQPRDDESRKLSEQLARAQALRDQIEGLTREASKLGQDSSSSGGEAGQSGQASQSGEAGQNGQAGQPQPGGANGSDASRLRDEYNRRLEETRKLLDEMRRDDAELTQGGTGFTFEGQGMVLSAPGTEAFKQDFAKWEALRKQVTLALDRAESSISQRLQARQARDRLAAGVDDKAPPSYQQQVDSYFKALATKKKP
jgi:hypothetical protein